MKPATQTVAASCARALSAASLAMRVAVPPVTHPPHAKPTTMVATMQLALDQNQTPLVGRYVCRDSTAYECYRLAGARLRFILPIVTGAVRRETGKE